jgi:hypothetical protein
MGKIVISTNVSLDGVVQDPDGAEGFRHGGWFDQFGGGDVVSDVAALKQELAGDILVYASYQLGRTLLEHDLVDELRRSRTDLRRSRAAPTARKARNCGAGSEAAQDRHCLSGPAHRQGLPPMRLVSSSREMLCLSPNAIRSSSVTWSGSVRMASSASWS